MVETTQSGVPKAHTKIVGETKKRKPAGGNKKRGGRSKK